MYLSLYAKVDWGLFLATYAGIFLLGACYVAIGIFASSITESMILAVALAIIMNLGLWLLALFGQNTDDALVQNVVNHISINYHFANMVNGRVELAGLVFMLSVIGFFTFLSQRAIEALRWK